MNFTERDHNYVSNNIKVDRRQPVSEEEQSFNFSDDKNLRYRFMCNSFHRTKSHLLITILSLDVMDDRL